MKYAAIIFSSVGLLLVLIFGAWMRADTESRKREGFANELTEESDDNVAFYASGMFGTKLVIIPEYADHEPGGQVACDAIVDWLIYDKKRISEIHAEGFTSIKCGTREVR